MKKYTYEILLFLATILFGTSYVAQGIVGNYLGPFSVNFIRYTISTLCLLPFVVGKKMKFNRDFVVGSLLLGLTVFVSPFLQQLVAPYTTSGKMGFMSSLYLVIVPILSYLMFKTKIRKLTLLSVLIAFAGLILLCDLDGLVISAMDLALIIVAVTYAFEIILMDIYSKKVDPLQLMFGSFAVSALINLIFTVFFEEITLDSILPCLPILLYLSIGSTCIAYALQAITQKYLDTIVATVIMSLESVISALAGYLILHQILSVKEMIGCAVVFIGVLLCELSMVKKNKV